jgi:hypothetical protein
MLDTEKRQEVIYFTGIEVEHTIQYGEKTLFVVGCRDFKEIVKKATETKCNHIYLGTSQCFTPEDNINKWFQWDQLIRQLLGKNYYVTLDFDVKYAPQVATKLWNTYSKFIPMISVKLPNLSRFNENATLKIDDTTWGHSNTGVWCHTLTALQDDNLYTDWKDYTGDSIV